MSQLGMLLTVLLFAIAAYFGSQLMPMWLKYYEILGHMEAVAKKAQVKDDREIRNFLEEQIRKLQLPLPDNRGLILRRTGTEIIMELEWEDVLVIDLGEDYYWELWVFYFNPRVKQRYK